MQKRDVQEAIALKELANGVHRIVMCVISSLQVLLARTKRRDRAHRPRAKQLDRNVGRADEEHSIIPQERVTAAEQWIGMRDVVDHVPHGYEVEGGGWQIRILQCGAGDLTQPKLLARISNCSRRYLATEGIPAWIG